MTGWSISLRSSPMRNITRPIRLAALTVLLVIAGACNPPPLSASTTAPQTPAAAFVDHCHATPDNLAWCEWVIFMQDPANAAWFAWATTPKPAVAASAPYGVWDRLAECESHGEWSYGPHSSWGSRIYEGGLQFHPGTWDAYAPAGYPSAAYNATRTQQIVVGERVLAAQGWGAWPACSRELGLR